LKSQDKQGNGESKLLKSEFLFSSETVHLLHWLYLPMVASLSGV